MNVLEAFQHPIARNIMGNTDRSVREECCECPPEEESIGAAGLCLI